MSPTPPPASGNVISVSSDGTFEEFNLDKPPVEEVGQDGESVPTVTAPAVHCPSCGAVNPSSNRHCQECGARLSQGPLPTAPRPAVQATAGVRAALAISGLLFVVIVVALLFNIFSNEEPVAGNDTTTTTTSELVIQESEIIDILDVECVPEGLGALTCNNLINGEGTEYQVNWEDLELAEEPITIRLIFRQPMIVTRIDWRNLDDPDRFRQNYRARGLTIDADGSLAQVPHELKDTPGLQIIEFVAMDANWVEITVQSDYQAEVVNNNVFRELAIDEITVWGRPPNPSNGG